MILYQLPQKYNSKQLDSVDLTYCHIKFHVVSIVKSNNAEVEYMTTVNTQ